jgi:D-alanyl-D-alanine endopeptidase (penicillin-binding protein 7)
MLAAQPAQAQSSRKARSKSQPSIARKAVSARARAVATAREMADTTVPRYKVDASGDLVPDLRAAAAIIYNPHTNEVLWEENSQDQRSIASITKVMTATVFLEHNPDLSQPVKIVRSDVYAASTTKLILNDSVTTDDLLHLLLIASDNAAARALARVSPQGSDGFIRRMNEKSAELGMTIHALEVMPDHVHLFVESDPTRCVAEIVNRLKGYTSRTINGMPTRNMPLNSGLPSER